MLTSVAREPKPLTPKQREIFAWYFAFTLEHGFQPTFREACERFGFASPNAIHGHLLFLAKKGWIRMAREAGANRALRFLRCPDGTPFYGLVPRTSPLEENDV